MVMQTSKAAFSVLLSFIMILPVALGTTFAQQAVENSWEKTTSMPKAVSDVKAVTVGDDIYIFSSNSTYLYEPDIEAWTQKKPMPTQRTDYAIAAVENKVYIIGGWAGSEVSINEVYDTTADTWETKQPLLQPRSWIEANVVNGKIYVIGGSTSDGRNEVYDLATDTWTNKTAMPADWGYGVYSAVIDEKIYCMTGLGTTLIYDTRSDTWTSGAPLPQTCRDSGIAVTTSQNAPKRIYVMSGMNVIDITTWDMSNHTYVYDPALNSWTRAADMPTARGRFAVAVLGDKIYAMGGVVGLFKATDMVEVYTPYGYVEPTPKLTPTPTLTPTATPSPIQTPTHDNTDLQTTWIAILTATIACGVIGLAAVWAKRKKRLA